MDSLEGYISVWMNESMTNNTMCHGFNTPEQIIFIVSYSLMFLVGLLLNGYILGFYLRQSQKSPCTMKVYLKNLVVADFMLSLSLPFYIINLTTTRSDIRVAYCNFGFAIFYLNMYGSIAFMAHIAYNRYLKIIHPFQTHMLQTVRAARITSAVSWIFLMTVVIIFASLSFMKPKKLTSFPSSCEDVHSEDVSLLHRIIHTGMFVTFLCVLLFMLYVYYRTCQEVSQAQQRQLSSSSSEKLAKSHRNMKVLIIVFCISFIPFHMVNLPYIFFECSYGEVLFLLQEITRAFSVLNICLDPFIYFTFSKDLREKLTKVLQRHKPTPNNGNSSS